MALISQAAQRLQSQLASAVGSTLVKFHGGAAPRTVEEMLDLLYGGLVNVCDKSFAGGADRLGVNDSTAAIQAAINATLATPSQWCKIYFPAGTYKISGALVLPETTHSVNKRFSFIGDGPLITTIQQTVSTQTIFDVQDLGVAGTMNTWRDIGFSGTNETTATSMPAIYGHLTVGIRVDNCWFTGFWRAIYSAPNGLGTPGTDLYVYNSVFEYCSTAIDLEGHTSATVTGCIFGTGSRIETGKYQIHGLNATLLKFHGNRFAFSIGRGAFFSNCTDVQFTDNEMLYMGSTDTPAAYGRVNIGLAGCAGVQIHNNSFYVDVAEDVIALNGGNTKISIRGNRFKKSAGASNIGFHNSANEAEITDNVFENSIYDGILTDTAAFMVNTRIANNTFKAITAGKSYVKVGDGTAFAPSVVIQNNLPREALCTVEGGYKRALPIVTTTAATKDILKIALLGYSTAIVTASIGGICQGSGEKGYSITWQIQRAAGVTTINVLTPGVAYGSSGAALALTLTTNANDSVLSLTTSSAAGFSGTACIDIAGQVDKLTLL